MKINSIEYENFRNFKDYGKITCSTDGKFTIIYGKNGDGKTTLHQLFHWVFYGDVNFNKTATEHLYNFSYEREQSYGSYFDVMGRIDFEDNGTQYSIKRTITYKKSVDSSVVVKEELLLLKLDDDHNWKKIDHASEMVEKLLPSGLSDYFFFDGESMIADLRVKGRDSAGKLRKALFSMFDLDVVENALNHIGEKDKKTTVLGKLYLSQAPIGSESELTATKTNIENAQNKIDTYNDYLKEAKDDLENQNNNIKKISELIAGQKSKSEYESERNRNIRQRDQFLKNAQNEQARFGETVIEMFPGLLISKAVEEAKEKIKLKVSKSKVPNGLNNRLIDYLLDESTNKCICGNDLCTEEIEIITSLRKLLPPNSYDALYHDFTHTASQMGVGYDKDKIESTIRGVIDNTVSAEECDQRIKDLDEEEKNSKDIEQLICDRQMAEDKRDTLFSKIAKLETEIHNANLYLNNQMKNFDKLIKENEQNKLICRRMDIIEEVANYFKDKLDNAATSYSSQLENNIQNLLNEMLTSKRTVSVSKDFAVRVTDSYDDETKSEGQFAVVSFAYIGGILKMLKDDSSLTRKEYPLVLDGPFSKLDSDQRKNVVEKLPQFATQVILLSKDDLHDVIPNENIGNVWTIQSNEEKNIAVIKEGKIWK